MKVPERASMVAGVPVHAAQALARYGLGAMHDTAELFLPMHSQEEFVRHLEAEQFDHDVTLATGAYEAGRRKKDPELGFYGGGWLLKLMCQGKKSPRVPARKVDGIAEYVAEEGLDPILEPYLSDEEAVMAAAILKKKQPVREGFFQKSAENDPADPSNE